MEIKRPKEIVQEVVSSTKAKTNEAFHVRSTSTLNGALYGGAFGFIFSYYKNQNKTIGTLLGVLIGGLVSNLLTIRKK